MANVSDRIKLGMKVRDQFSGLEGQVVSIINYLYGCQRIGIQPYGSKDGKPYESFWIDEPQCDVVEEPKTAPAAPRHGDGSVPPARSVPQR